MTNLEKLAKLNNVSLYAEKVDMLVREKYTISDELAILRQRDTKPEEFQKYFNYVEECKKKAKEITNEK